MKISRPYLESFSTSALVTIECRIALQSHKFGHLIPRSGTDVRCLIAEVNALFMCKSISVESRLM